MRLLPQLGKLSRRRAWRRGIAPRILGHALTSFSAGVLTVVLASALAAPWLARYSPGRVDVLHALSAPSAVHWLGTDDLGRDLYARMLYGGRLSLTIAISTGALAGVFGTFVGVVAGCFRATDVPLMFVMDGLMAFPAILLALAIVAILGPLEVNVILALTLVFIPRVARVVRAVTLLIRDAEYVEAAQAVGVKSGRLIWRYVLPNLMGPVLVQTTLILAFALLAEAGLSFLGVGAPADTPSWGGIIADGRLFLASAPWLTVFPGIAIALTVLAVNVLGDTLRDLLDPRLRGVS